LEVDKQTQQTKQNDINNAEAEINKHQKTIDNITSWRAGRSK
jgi:hypothetical protein